MPTNAETVSTRPEIVIDGHNQCQAEPVSSPCRFPRHQSDRSWTPKTWTNSVTGNSVTGSLTGRTEQRTVQVRRSLTNSVSGNQIARAASARPCCWSARPIFPCVHVLTCGINSSRSSHAGSDLRPRSVQMRCCCGCDALLYS